MLYLFLIIFPFCMTCGKYFKLEIKSSKNINLYFWQPNIMRGAPLKLWCKISDLNHNRRLKHLLIFDPQY